MPKFVPVRHHLDRHAEKLAAAGEGNPDELLTTQQMASWFGLSTQWLEIGRNIGYGPPFVTLAPKCVRYRRSDVLAFLEARRHQCTSEYRPPKRKRKARRGRGA